MKVILTNTSEVKDVSFGYAVNYLLPKGLAIRATDEEIKKLEIKKLKEQQVKNEEEQRNAKLAHDLAGKEFIIKAKAGKKGKLYGTITKKDLAKKLGVPKAVVALTEPIKKVGEYQIQLKFGSEKTIVKVTVEEGE